MKIVKLNEQKRKNGSFIPIEVEEEKLEFRNNIAVAKGRYTKEFRRVYGDIPIWGVINEDFEEVFSNANLMFYEFNQNITRFGDNDFIVKVNCAGFDQEWVEYRHVRVLENNTFLVNKWTKGFTKTDYPNIILIDKSYLYDVQKGEVITPAFLRITKDTENPGIFKVLDAVSSRVVVDKRLVKPSDYVYFKANDKKIVSKVISLLDNKELDLPENISYLLKDFEDIRKIQQDKLQNKGEDFNFLVRKLEIKKD